MCVEMFSGGGRRFYCEGLQRNRKDRGNAYSSIIDYQ
jgi:hypothetical protein